MKKERFLSCDFMRAICALGIAIMHYYPKITGFTMNYPYNKGEIEPSAVIVTIFFMLSGAMLYYSNPKISSLKIFYYKRWKSIYPFFWMAFFTKFFINVFRAKKFFYMGNPPILLLSIVGLDGYFNYRTDLSYYMLGEWFLGAIILLYLFYPFVLKIYNWFKGSDIIATILIIVAYFWMIDATIFKIDHFTNLISCLFSFVMGIMFMKYRKWLTNWYVVMVSLILSVALYLGAFNTILELSTARNHFMGYLLFAAFFVLGDYVMKVQAINKVFTELSKLSYCFFLLQHVVISFILKRYMPTTVASRSILLLACLIIIIVGAKILHTIVTKLLNTKFFLKIENKILE